MQSPFIVIFLSLRERLVCTSVKTHALISPIISDEAYLRQEGNNERDVLQI